MDDAERLARETFRQQVRDQGGAFTRRQALLGGVTPAQVRARLRAGTWVALERGVYVSGVALSEADVHQRHALHVAARALATGSDAVACRRSAAVVLGLPLLGPAPGEPQMSRPPRRQDDTASAPSLRVAPLHPDDVVLWRGVRCTAPARLVCDTARTHGSVEALLMADAALRAGLDAGHLAAAAARAVRWPGAAAIPPVLAMADRRVDTPLESLTRWVLHSLGLPAPLSQVDVLQRGRWLGRVDFAWPDLGVVLECDGMLKYRSSAVALVDEKRRELALRRAGLEVLRTTWDDAWHEPEAIGALWRRHVELAAAQTTWRTETTFVLATLEATGRNGIPFPSRAAAPLAA